MLSTIEKRTIQKTVIEQGRILSSSKSALEKRKAQKIKLDAMARLGLVAVSEKSELQLNENKGQIAAVKANPNATTLIADAISNALANTNGSVTTGDGLIWALNKTALNKMIAATNKDGDKPYQRERILAIQSLNELAKAAVNPSIREDDGRDEQMDKVYEYHVPFALEEKTFDVRLLCKKFKDDAKDRKDKMHSMALDNAKKPASQQVTNGLLIDLELVLLDVKGGVSPETSDSPSVDNDFNIAQSEEKSTDTSAFGLTQSGKKTRERINAAVADIVGQIKAGKDPKSLTSEETALFMQYSGKGGLSDNSQYEYYTPTPIAEGVWDLLAANGFENGNVLEPSTGSGVFSATKKPGSVITGTEIDPIAATVNQVLHPEDNISNQSFEKLAVSAPDNHFDAVIGNVPFGNARGPSANDDPEFKGEKR